MANATDRALSHLEELSRQLSHLRRDLAGRVRPTRKAGAHLLHDAQHGALAVAEDLGEHGRATAHLLGRQARRASIAISKDPVPLVVALGTFVLLSSLFTHRR